jgi:hypothetical protein
MSADYVLSHALDQFGGCATGVLSKASFVAMSQDCIGRYEAWLLMPGNA